MKEKLLLTRNLLQTKHLLQTKLLRLLVGSIFAASLLIGLMGIVNAGMVSRAEAARIMDLLGEKKVQEINSRLQTVQQSVESVYHYADEKLARADQLVYQEFYIDTYCKQVYEVLKNAVESTDSATAAYLRINPNLLYAQKGVYLRRTENGEFADHEMTEIPLEEQGKADALAWYFEPIANGKPTWMKPYWDDNVGAYMISYVIPIFYGYIPIGVVGMDIELTQLRDVVSEVKVYESGHAFLMSSDGDMIYHKDYPNGVDKEAFDSDLRELASLVSNGNEGEVYKIRWKGENKRILTHHLMNGMFLTISAPAKEINRTRNVLMWQLITVFLIIMTVAIFLSTKFARQMTKPLADLTEVARRIAAGERNAEIKCNSSDETGVLAIALQEMMDELNKQAEHMNELAYSDMLTGLHNRHYMVEYCLEYANGEAKDAGVIFCDLNRLKYVNDNFGHPAGDGLICRFADMLKNMFPNDMCCRLSGDEFLVIILDISKEDFVQKVETFRKMNAKGEVPMASIGYCYKEKAHYIGEMMNEAEDDMYKDKKKFYEQFPMYKR